MAVTNDKRGFPGIAASAVGEGMAVAHASGGVRFGVHPATMLSAARLAGLAARLWDEDWEKVVVPCAPVPA